MPTSEYHEPPKSYKRAMPQEASGRLGDEASMLDFLRDAPRYDPVTRVVVAMPAVVTVEPQPAAGLTDECAVNDAMVRARLAIRADRRLRR